MGVVKGGRGSWGPEVECREKTKLYLKPSTDLPGNQFLDQSHLEPSGETRDGRFPA